MRRGVAALFGLAWIAALLTADWWFIREFKVAEAHVKTALAGIFAAPVSFGGLTLGPTFVQVSDVRLMRPDNPNKLYGTIDEVKVTPRWSKLLTSLELEVEEIAVQNPTLVVRWNPADRTFDMPSPLREALEPRATTAELPAITLKGLTLALENPPDIVKQRQNFLFKDLSITLAPEGSRSWLYRFEVDANHPILGTMRGFGRFRKDAFEIEVRRNGLMVTPALLGVVNADVKKFLEQLSVGGDLTVTASVGPVNGGTAEAFSATIECHGMSAQVKDWPQALTNVRGRIEYAQGRLSSTDGIAGEFEGAPIIVRGAIDLSGGRKVVDASGEIVRLGITNELAARIRKLPEPCPTIADQIEAWDPDGHANVKFTLSRERDENQKPGPLNPFISVEFSGGSKIRYIGHVGDDGRRHGFAYPLNDLRGTIKFTDKVASFDRLTAMNGSLAVEAHGTIDYERGGDETYDVDVDARGLMLDERVSQALEGASRELFNSLVADGSADLAVAIKRKKGEKPGPRVDITVDLGGVSLWPQQFPVDLADARGRLVITDAGPVKIEKVTARRQGGLLSISGIVPVARGPTQLSLDISVDKFQIDGAVTSALGRLAPGVAGTLTKLNPVGKIDGTLHVGALPDGSIGDIRGAIRFDDVTLAPEDPSVRIENVGGSIAILPTMVRINEGTTGQIAGERFAVRGTIKTAPEDPVLELTVEAENFQVDRELLADLEPLIPWLHKSEKKPELAGPMSVVLRAIGPVTKPEYHVELDFHGVDIVSGALPGVPLNAVQGKLTVTPAGVVTLRDFSTRIPIPQQAGTIPAPGGGTGAESTSRPSILVTLADGRFDPAGGTPIKPVPERLTLNGCSVVGLELTPSVLSMIPVGADLGATIAKLGLTGAVDLVFPNVKWDGTELRASKGQLLASRVAIGEERKLTADFFQIDKLSLKAGGGLFDLGGQFFLRGARVFDIPVPACNGRIAADMSGLRFESLDADLLGYDQDKKGQRFALGKINPEESRLEFQFDQGTFEANLRLQEVNLPATFRALGGNPGQVSGTYRVALDLGGVLSDTATYRGKGDLSIRARNVVSLPVFYKMFNSLDVLTFFQRTDPWTKVEVVFEVKDSVIRMEKIRIDSPDVLLEGPGTLTFAGMVKANLRANGGLGISPIGWVTRIISKAVFAGVTIDGPVGDPKVDAYSAAGR